MAKTKNRPVYLNLLQIHQPVTAVVSIGHRISGVLLFLAVPLLIYLLDLSLQGPQGYARASAVINSGAMRVVAVLLIWSVAHHFFAGVRFLLIDLGIGDELAPARRSAWLVHGATLLVTISAVLVLLL